MHRPSPTGPIWKRFGLAALLLAALAASGCAGEQDVTVIKLGHALDTEHPVHKAMEFMAERLAEESGGTMRIDIYPSQQLGLSLLQLRGELCQ